MEPRQPQQLKHEWKTPEMVKQSGKTRREVEPKIFKKEVKRLLHRVLFFLWLTLLTKDSS